MSLLRVPATLRVALLPPTLLLAAATPYCVLRLWLLPRTVCLY